MTKLPPECPIEIRLSLSKSLWFDMVFVVGNQGRVVETSDSMWDIGELFHWLGGIARGESEVLMSIDREGAIDNVLARYIDEKRLHLTIYDGLNDDIYEEPPFIDAVVSRRKLVWEIYFELRQFALKIGHHYKVEKNITNPDWTKSTEIEKWLDWEKHTGLFSMKDDLTGLDRI